MYPIFRRCAVPLLLVSAACADHATRATLPPDPPAVPTPLGVYEVEVTGLGGAAPSSTIRAAGTVGSGPSRTLTTAAGSIVFEQVASSSFTEGTRTGGGQRYISFTYRVRNATGSTLNNITMLAVSRAGTIAGTPISSLKRFDGANADTAIAKYVAPTGSVALRSDLVSMQALDPDVMQVFTESEVAAISLPGDVTGVFPYGYVVGSATPGATTRTLPANPSANQFDGVLTLSFRLPLQSTSAADVFSIVFQVLAVQDSETRMTESMEEAQDSSAVRRLRERAAALGATTVTVLPGSPAAGADVADYTGQRQLCTVRTAGTAASPTTFITTPAGYTRLAMLRPGESASACGADFRTGTATRPTLNSSYAIGVRAMDRYGNVVTGTVDTVALTQTSGPAATFGASAALVSGAATLTVTYTANGTSLLNAVGKRLRGQRSLEVATAATVVVNGGDNQAAMAGSAVPTRPSVLVRDLSNNPLSGVPVTFSVASGGGYVTAASAVTNASGVATVGSWVLGSPAALSTLTATAAGASAPATFTASGCSGGGGTGFGMTLCFTTVVTPLERAALEAGAARWQEIVVGDLADVTLSAAAGSCGTGSPSFNLTIDDLLLFVGVQTMDGHLGAAGFANTCYVRTGAQTIAGFLRLDTDDIAYMDSTGILPGAIQHEMGHVLGIGTLWTAFGLLVNPSPVGGPPLDTYYSGAGGIAGFNQIGGSTYTGGQKVPVENTGSLSRINGHWRDSVLVSEVMTPHLDSGPLPISLLTVRSLADLGYTVDTARADAFFLTLSLRAGGPAPGGLELADDVPYVPLYGVDERGRVTRVR